jgi:type I restriction enzyme R subunit
LKGADEYGLFTVLRGFAPVAEESYVADCARRMVAHLQKNQMLTTGWSGSKTACKRVELSLHAESWGPFYAALGFDPNDPAPAFLIPAVEELKKTDTQV